MVSLPCLSSYTNYTLSGAIKALMQRKMQKMLKRRIFRLSDIEYGVDVVYTGSCTLEGYLWWRENMCIVIMMY